MNRADAVEELKQVYSVLNADFVYAREAAIQNPTEFHKRTLVRTCFALIEGLAYQLRHVTLATLQDTDFLSEGELAVLKETMHRLNQSGDIEDRDNFQTTLPMMLFTLRVYAKNHGACFEPKTSDNGWSCLKKAVKIRDRLMHPKSLQDLSITDDEGAIFSAGVSWWDHAMWDLFQVCEAADKKHLQVQ